MRTANDVRDQALAQAAQADQLAAAAEARLRTPRAESGIKNKAARGLPVGLIWGETDRSRGHSARRWRARSCPAWTRRRRSQPRTVAALASARRLASEGATVVIAVGNLEDRVAVITGATGIGLWLPPVR